jgi:hypothetical protein
LSTFKLLTFLSEHIARVPSGAGMSERDQTDSPVKHRCASSRVMIEFGVPPTRFLLNL